MQKISQLYFSQHDAWDIQICYKDVLKKLIWFTQKYTDI